MEKNRTTHFDAEERDFLRQRVVVLEKTVDELREINQDLAEERDFFRQRVVVLEKTVDELREINQDLAEENGRLEREIKKYQCVIEAIEARINKRRKDIQEITKRLHQATMSSRAALKYSKEMESCLDQEEHYADIVY